MKKIILFLLLIPFCIDAQRPFVKEEKMHQQVTIKYSQNNGTADPLIKMLAEGNGKSVQSTQIIISTDQRIITDTREPLQHINILSDEITISGDIYYKGYDMSGYLIPSQVQYILKTWKGNTVLASVPFSHVNVSHKKPEKRESIYDDSLGQVTHRIVENFLPVYSSADIQKFNERVKLINQYFSDAVRITETINRLHSINPNDIDHFSIQQQKLVDANRNVSEIESKNYNSALSLQQYDPAKMLNNLSLYHSEAARVQHDLDLVFSTLYLAYYDRGMALIRYGNISGAENYFQLSLSTHPGFAPALLQLALIDYRNNNFNEVISKVDDILYRFDPDPDTRRLTYQLLNDFYESRLDKAATQLNNEEYQKALEFYNMAKSICEKYTNIRCTDELFKGIRAAKNGIYNEYLDAANDFLEKKRFDKAEQVIYEAINYQRNNSSDITDASEARKILKEISYQRYISKIEEGKQALTNKQFETALKAFEDATEMESNSGFAANTELPSLKTNAVHPVIALKLNSGDSLVNINKLPEARNIVRTIADMQAKYLLGAEKTINKRLEELRKKIFSQQCENAQREFDDAYVHAKDALSKPDYIRADDFFIQAEKINIENKDCSVDTRKIIEEHAAIVPAATYLKMIAEVNRLQQEGNYSNAQTKYEEAGKYFTDNNVSIFTISHESFYDYLLHKTNNGFLYYSAEQYAANNELDKALTLFRLLLSHNYDNRQLKGSLYQLGIKFGKKDKRGHPGEKYSNDYVREYTNRDRKMKSFEKGYKKGWKSWKH